MIFPDTYKFNDNFDENFPDRMNMCTMTVPATETEAAEETPIECDCRRPEEFMYLNKGMIFYTLESPEYFYTLDT